MQPETHYAKSGELRIAYQVVGNGPFDLVFVPGFVSNLDNGWDEPGMAKLYTHLGSFARLILFDKRGTGLSDRDAQVPSLEQRMDDIRAVMDAAGSKRAAILGVSEGGAMAMLFAATFPERVQSLVLYGAYGHFPTWVLPSERLEAFIVSVEAHWGSGESIKTFAPEYYDDLRLRKWWARFERLSASPSAVVALMRMNSAALAAVPQIEEISLTAPNKHYLLVNLAPFGLENDNQVFLPTDEPHGQIECAVGRA